MTMVWKVCYADDRVWGIFKCHHSRVAEPSYGTKEMQVRGEHLIIVSDLERRSPMELKLWVGCRVQYATCTGMTMQLSPKWYNDQS